MVRCVTDRFTHLVLVLLNAVQKVIESNVITGRLRLKVPVPGDFIKLFVLGWSRFMQFKTQLDWNNPVSRTVALKNRTIVLPDSVQRIVAVTHEPMERKPGTECPGCVIERRERILQHECTGCFNLDLLVD